MAITRSRLLAALAPIAGVLLSTSAAAFVLPADAIFRHLGKERDEMRLFSLKVEGSLSLQGAALKDSSRALGAAPDKNELSADATILLKLPGKCRLELLTTEGIKAAAVHSLGKLRAEGPSVPAVAAALEQICLLLATRSSQDLPAEDAYQRYLKGLKVDSAATSLARFGGQVAYIVGGLEGEAKPQVWIYKDSFMPARAIYSDDQGPWDVRFLDYTSAATGEWFPRVIEIYKGQELELRFTALKAETKVSLADRLF